MLRRYVRNHTTVLLLLAATPAICRAQTSSAVIAVQQTLLAHVGTSGLPGDLTAQGQLSDQSGTRPLRIFIKGKDKIRYEVGTGGGTTTTIYTAGAAWTGTSTAMKPLPDHVALHRAVEVPFFDVIADAGDARFKAQDFGLEQVGAAHLRHFSLRMADATPTKRFLNRPLDEDVDIFIDPATNIIVRSRRMKAATESMDFRVPWITDFSDYRVIN